MSIVFDSSALLAITFEEEGAEIAAQALNDGIISAVNASEVITRYVDLGASEEEALTSFRAFGLEIYPFDESLAIATGLMRSATRDAGLSLGDRACLALAIREHSSVLTADRAWATLDLDIVVELIR
ncbi:MAG: type II toxin-antitoxin system VapC family toxin [Gammaproteobacteria bacterium]|nr:type II toxin-antitoxin system VapC family toxin [Gammaproteobacteria bacterium]